MAKGFTDSSGKFRPTGNNGTSSRKKSTHPTGMQIAKVEGNDGNVEVFETEITIYDDDGQEVVKWVSDEWEEDPSVIPAIKNAVKLANEDKIDELKENIGFIERGTVDRLDRFGNPIGTQYNIVRFYNDGRRNKIIHRNVSDVVADLHTNDPRTRKAGVYFDGFRKV